MAIEQILPARSLFRAPKARHAADKLVLGPTTQETGLVLVDALGRPVRPERYSDHYRRLLREAESGPSVLIWSATHWPTR